MRLFNLLKKNTEGATILEFAIVAPALFLLLVGFIEVGMILFVNTALEGATNIGARIGQTGDSQGNGQGNGVSRDTYIRNQIYNYSGGFLDPASLTITMLTYNDFSDIGQPEPCISPAAPPCPGTPGVNFIDINGNGIWDADMGQAGAGGSGSVVLYRVSYPWHLFTPLLRNIMGDSNGIYTITAVAPVRNEPF